MRPQSYVIISGRQLHSSCSKTRLSSLGLSPYSYNSSNQLTSTPAATFTYDNNGNTLTKMDSNGVTGYTWDYENRLTSVTLPGTAGTVTFKYDPFGRRIQKSGPTGITNYLYDGANVVTDLDANGAVVASYAQGSGIDEPLASITAAGTAFFEADGLGSVSSLSGASGITDTYTYNAFGATTATGSNPNRFRYTGREWDSETGLYYYRARYYDPAIGRFISEDPIDFDGGINFFAYVGSDPLNWFDPFGLDRMSLGDIANLVAKNNKSGQSNELIICMAYKESTFDPDASLPGNQSARGLLGVTDAAATQVGVDYDDLGDPATNIAAGSSYLAWRIHHNHGNVRNGLWGYGTGKAYADSLLKCEKCLVTHTQAKATDECKTKDCLEPLHPKPKPKHPRSRPRRARRPRA